LISGVDASNLNGPQDWAALKCDRGLSFAVLKATEGTTFTDDCFAASWRAAKDLGLARGAYHYGHPSLLPPEQARFFLETVTAQGLDDADFLVLDHEEPDGLAPSAVSAWARSFCSALSAKTGRKITVYTYLDFAWAGNCAGLGTYPLWIADPSTPPGKPRVPGPWTSWAVHQYGPDGLDLDVACYPDCAAMSGALGKQQVKAAGQR
jgi:GH25 family lysozyme M1 (1,4-beta-N-acetylmuramidase)